MSHHGDKKVTVLPLRDQTPGSWHGHMWSFTTVPGFWRCLGHSFRQCHAQRSRKNAGCGHVMPMGICRTGMPRAPFFGDYGMTSEVPQGGSVSTTIENPSLPVIVVPRVCEYSRKKGFRRSVTVHGVPSAGDPLSSFGSCCDGHMPPITDRSGDLTVAYCPDTCSCYMGTAWGPHRVTMGPQVVPMCYLKPAHMYLWDFGGECVLGYLQSGAKLRTQRALPRKGGELLPMVCRVAPIRFRVGEG